MSAVRTSLKASSPCDTPATSVAAGPAPTSAGPRLGTDSVPSRRSRLLSLALGLVTLVAAVPTVIDQGLLRGPAAMNGSARGTALVMVVCAVPLLTFGARSAGRGSLRAWPLWLGAAGYLLYNGVMLVFGTPFNHAFLAYVGVLGLAIWTIVSVLADLDVEGFASRLRAALSVRAVRGIAVYTWAIVALNALLWLKAAVPASLEDGTPQVLDGTGLTTIPTYVQDLAFWLPLMGIAAWWLWCRASWGLVLVSSGLMMWVLESIGVAVDQYWGHLADPASTVVAPQMIPVFAVLALIGLIPVAMLLRHLPPTR